MPARTALAVAAAVLVALSLAPAAEAAAPPSSQAPFSLAHGETRTVGDREVACEALRAEGRCFYDAAGSLLGVNPGVKFFSLGHQESLLFLASPEGAAKALRCDALRPQGRCFYDAEGAPLGVKPRRVFELDDGARVVLRNRPRAEGTELACDAPVEGGGCFYNRRGTALGTNPRGAFSLEHGERLVVKNRRRVEGTEVACDALLDGGVCFHGRSGKALGANPGAAFSLENGDDFTFRASADGAAKVLSCRDAGGCDYDADGKRIRPVFSLAPGETRRVDGAARLSVCRDDGRGACYFRADGRLRHRAGPSTTTGPAAFARFAPKRLPADESRFPRAEGPNADLAERFLKTGVGKVYDYFYYHAGGWNLGAAITAKHLIRIGAIAAHERGTTGAAVQSDDPAKRRAQTSVMVRSFLLSSPHPDLPNAWWTPTPKCGTKGIQPTQERCYRNESNFPVIDPAGGLPAAGIIGAADNGQHALGVAPGTQLLIVNDWASFRPRPSIASSFVAPWALDERHFHLPGVDRAFCLSEHAPEGTKCGDEDKEFAAALGRYEASYYSGYFAELPDARFIHPDAGTTDLATLNQRLAEENKADSLDFGDSMEHMEAIVIDDKGTSGTREDWADDTLRAHPAISNLVAINFGSLHWGGGEDEAPVDSYRRFFKDEDKGDAAKIFYGSYYERMEALGAYSLDPEENLFADRYSRWERFFLRLGRLGVVSVIPQYSGGHDVATANRKLASLRRAGFPAPKGRLPLHNMWLSFFAAPGRETAPYILNVVAVDARNGFISDGGAPRPCGALKARCIAAPGAAVSLSESKQGLHFGPGNVVKGVEVYRGARAAAPQVTGAVALAASFFKPTMQGYDGVKAAQRLLDTTQGLGACAGMTGKACRDAGALDDETGHGLLDIDAALKPVGTAVVPSGGAVGQGAPIALDAGHEARAPAAFGGLGVRLAKAARSAVAIDDLDHAFAGLAEVEISTSGVRPLSDLFHARTAPRAAGFSTPIGGGAMRLALANGAAPDTSAAPEADGARRHFASAAWGLETPARLLSGASEVSLSFAPGGGADGADGRSGAGGRAGASFGGAPGADGRPGRGGRFWVSMISRRLSLSERTTEARQTPSDEPGKMLLRLGWTGPVGAAAMLRLEAARLSEDREALGGTTSGLFGELARARTDLISLGAEWEPTFGSGRLGAADRAGADGRPGAAGRAAAAWTLLGEITAGRLSARASGGLLSRWESAALSGWALAARRERPAPGGGASIWGFSASQPLRAESGAVALDLPVALQEDGETLAIDRRRVPLAASGRELRLEVSRERTLPSGASLKGRLIRRLEAGHDAGADPETGLALELRLPFLEPAARPSGARRRPPPPAAPGRGMPPGAAPGAGAA